MPAAGYQAPALAAPPSFRGGWGRGAGPYKPRWEEGDRLLFQARPGLAWLLVGGGGGGKARAPAKGPQRSSRSLVPTGLLWILRPADQMCHTGKTGTTHPK